MTAARLGSSRVPGGYKLCSSKPVTTELLRSHVCVSSAYAQGQDGSWDGYRSGFQAVASAPTPSGRVPRVPGPQALGVALSASAVLS